MLMHTRGHPRHDARERDGAHRQAGARLLRRRVGRGQLRHRRLRADHGPERPGAVLGARPRRRLPDAARLLRAHLRGARASASRAAPRPPIPLDRDVARLAALTRPGSDLARVGDVFSDDDATPGARSRSTSARSCARRSTTTTRRSSAGPAMRDAETAVVWDAHLGGWPVSPARHRVAPAAAPRPRPRRRPRAVDLGHAVPALVEEDRARDQRRQRQPAARRARQPRRLRRLARVDARAGSSSSAPRSAARSSTSTARSSSASSRATTAAPSWSSRSGSTRPRGGRARGRARLGDRRRAGRGGRLRPRRRAAARPPTRASSRSTSASRPPRAPSAQRLRAERAALWADVLRREARRGRRRVRRRPQRRARGADGLGAAASSPPASLRPYLIDAVERGMRAHARAARSDRWRPLAG